MPVAEMLPGLASGLLDFQRRSAGQYQRYSNYRQLFIAVVSLVIVQASVIGAIKGIGKLNINIFDITTEYNRH